MLLVNCGCKPLLSFTFTFKVVGATSSGGFLAWYAFVSVGLDIACAIWWMGHALNFLKSIIQNWQRMVSMVSLYTVSRKDVPPFTCYNLDIHGSVATISSKNVAEKVGNQNVLYFPTSPNYCFCTTWRNRKPRNCVFSLKCCMIFFYQKHETQLKISLGQSWTTLCCQNDRLGAPDSF